MKNRNSNFELMRIISMLFIVLWHTFIWGKVLDNCANEALKVILQIINYFIIIHVNSFILLSGYFQSKSSVKISKIFKLVLQVIFYMFICLILAIRLKLIQDYNIVTIMNTLLPSAINKYWFINCYIITYIFSDYINKFINLLSKKDYKNFIILCFVVLSVLPFITGGKVLNNTGYNFYHFIFLYLIGGYIRRYNIKDSYHFKNITINGYRILLLFSFLFLGFSNFLLNYFATNISGISNILNEFSSRVLANSLSYSTPIVIIQSVIYFEFFGTLKLKTNFINKVINRISSCVFGVYLIHENYLIREYIYKFLKINNGLFYGYKHLLYTFLLVFVIFFICVIIELLRQAIFKIFFRIKFINNIKNKIYDFILSLKLGLKI